jgi:hypothetical protein
MAEQPIGENLASPLPELLEIARQFSARSPKSTDLVAADLGIIRGDWVDFFDHLESEFAVDLDCVSPKGRKGEARDISLEELALIMAEQSQK